MSLPVHGTHDYVDLLRLMAERALDIQLGATRIRGEKGDILTEATGSLARVIREIAATSDIGRLRLLADRAVLHWERCLELPVDWRDRSDAFWVTIDLRDLAYDLVGWLACALDVIPTVPTADSTPYEGKERETQ